VAIGCCIHDFVRGRKWKMEAIACLGRSDSWNFKRQLNLCCRKGIPLEAEGGATRDGYNQRVYPPGHRILAGQSYYRVCTYSGPVSHQHRNVRIDGMIVTVLMLGTWKRWVGAEAWPDRTPRRIDSDVPTRARRYIHSGDSGTESPGRCTQLLSTYIYDISLNSLDSSAYDGSTELRVVPNPEHGKYEYSVFWLHH
jgi:hypothetical protein